MGAEKNKSIVTGAAGFLGSHVVDLLLKNSHHVIAIDDESNGSWSHLEHWEENPDLTILNQDICSLKKENPLFKNIDYIFHLAGKECPLTSLKNPRPFFQTNINGTLRILQVALESNLKAFVYASSSAVYGLPNIPTLERDETIPQTPSALSKYLAEQSVFHWGALYGFKTISLRIFDAYGPRSISKIFPGNEFTQLMTQKFHKKKGIILGGGDQKRDFIFCTDVANAFLTAAEEGRDREIYNIASGKSKTLNDLCHLIQIEKESLSLQAPWPFQSWADISKFQFDCNWQPRVPFEKGLQFSLNVLPAWKNSRSWEKEEYKELISPLKRIQTI